MAPRFGDIHNIYWPWRGLTGDVKCEVRCIGRDVTRQLKDEG